MRIDHGRTAVHDMRHELIGHVHDISVPASDTSTARALEREGYGWNGTGWLDRDGKHGPTGRQFYVYSRTEHTDGRTSKPIRFW